MPKAFIMVGIPGSGKTTTIGQIIDLLPSYPMIISTDNYIENIAAELGKTYDEVFIEHRKDATKQAEKDIEEAIKNDYHIIFDQTNLSKKKRVQRIKQLGPHYRVNCHAFIVDVDNYDIIERRIANRPGKTIPRNVMKNMLNSYELPTMAEGYHKLTYERVAGLNMNSYYQRVSTTQYEDYKKNTFPIEMKNDPHYRLGQGFFNYFKYTINDPELWYANNDIADKLINLRYVK